jgi:hypothetical protein
MFGDSYFSVYDTRWVYYALQDNFLNCAMLNAYAGEASTAAMDALQNLLKITVPKMVVWCLGMNDPDSSSAVNASWKSSYDMLVQLQTKYGFQLVLYTVPTTPTMNNNYKNAIIRESGYRYIDADNAVRIDSEGHWVGNGTDYATLSPGDNVHPTTYGAKLLYYKIIADCPEIMSDY